MLRSLARKAITSATSAGSARPPQGDVLHHAVEHLGRGLVEDHARGMPPGATEFTRIPFGASERASVFVKLWIAPLVHS